MAEFLRLVQLGQVRLGSLVTHQFDIDDAARAYQTILDPSGGSLAVVLRYPLAATLQNPAPFVPRRRVEVVARPHGPSAMRVALIGAGNLARWVHLPTLQKLERWSCAPSARRAAPAAWLRPRFGASYCCSDYDEILRDDHVDAVVILTRNQHHAAQAAAALQAGKHVFVEKPMALTREECRHLEDIVRASGKQLTVGFNRRFAPYYKAMKQQVHGRSSPAVVTCRINSPGFPGRTGWPTRRSVARSSAKPATSST